MKLTDRSLLAEVSKRDLLKAMGAGSLAALGAPAFSAFAQPATGGGNGNRGVIASVPSYTNQYFTLWRLGGREAAEALGLSYVMDSYEGSAPEQVSQLQSAKSAGAAQVVSFLIDSGALPQVAQDLDQQDIYLSVAFSVDPWVVPSDPRFGGHFVTSFLPQEVLGQKALSKAVFDAIGGKGNVIYLQGSPTDTTTFMRTLGFKQALAEAPGIKMLGTQFTGETQVSTQPVIEAFLTNFSNIDAVICHNSSMALAVNASLRARGLDHIKVGSTDEEVPILDAMIEGPNQVAVRSIFGSWLGGYAIVRNFDVGQGVKLNPVEHMMYQDAVILDTKEAAQQYKTIGFESATTGFDWKKMSRALNPDNWDTQVGMVPMVPEDIFTNGLGKPMPSSFSYPPDLKQALDAGDVQKYAGIYRSHVVNNPFAPAIRATKTGKTVFGVSYS
jgi:ribose transport system substrate-binding protein